MLNSFYMQVTLRLTTRKIIVTTTAVPEIAAPAALISVVSPRLQLGPPVAARAWSRWRRYPSIEARRFVAGSFDTQSRPNQQERQS